MLGNRKKESLFIVMHEADISVHGGQILVATGVDSVYYEIINDNGAIKEFVFDYIRGACIHYVNISCSGSCLRGGIFLDTYMFFEKQSSERFIRDFMKSTKLKEEHFNF